MTDAPHVGLPLRLFVRSKVWAATFLLAACGSELPTWRTLPVPSDSAAKESALRDTGRTFFRALGRGRPGQLRVRPESLEELVTPEAAQRFRLARVNAIHPTPDPEAFLPFRQTVFRGLCLQNARLEPAGTVLGLYEPAWVFDRALVVGGQETRFAAWLEGTFVYTTRGFVALTLARVEAPRWEHADLELATCDVEVGRR